MVSAITRIILQETGKTVVIPKDDVFQTSEDKKYYGYLLDDCRAEKLARRLCNCTGHPLQVTRAEIFLTAACNMKCRYCNSTQHEMPPWRDKDIFNLLDRLAERGTAHIQWTGGEATVHPGLLSFISYSFKNGMANSISTNGTADAQFYLDLAEKGVSHFSISLDHPTPSL